MDKELLRQALGKLLLGVLLTALLLFLPAGTLHWWNAWLLMAVLFVPMLIAGLVMLFKAPELLRRRLNAKERQTEQKGVIAWSGLTCCRAPGACCLRGFSCWAMRSLARCCGKTSTFPVRLR